MDKVRRIVGRPNVRPFHFICLWTRIIQRITRLRRKIMWILPLKIYNSEASQNTFKLYFPPRNKLYYKNLLTLVKRLSVWFDHIMMSFMMLWQFWMRQISNNRKLKKRKKNYYPVPLWQSQVSQQVALENLRPHNCCDPLAFVYYDLIFFTLKMILIKTDNTK